MDFCQGSCLTSVVGKDTSDLGIPSDPFKLDERSLYEDTQRRKWPYVLISGVMGKGLT